MTDDPKANLEKVVKKLDDTVIIVTVALSFAAAILFAVVMNYGLFFPPTLLALLLGISVSALTYRFLGGTEGTKFSVGLLGLGGSAALLVGITWFVGDRLRAEFSIYDDSKSYRSEIERLKNVVEERDAQIAQELTKSDKLRRQITGMPSAQVDLSVAGLKKLKPQDDFVGTVRRMVRAGDYPFVDTLKSIETRIAVVSGIGDKQLYNICRAKFQELYGEDASNTYVRVSRSAGADGEPQRAILDRAGFIDNDICSKADRQFDVQIGCGTAMKLFSDKQLASCADTTKLRGASVTISSLPSE